MRAAEKSCFQRQERKRHFRWHARTTSAAGLAACGAGSPASQAQRGRVGSRGRGAACPRHQASRPALVSVNTHGMQAAESAPTLPTASGRRLTLRGSRVPGPGRHRPPHGQDCPDPPGPLPRDDPVHPRCQHLGGGPTSSNPPSWRGRGPGPRGGGERLFQEESSRPCGPGKRCQSTPSPGQSWPPPNGTPVALQRSSSPPIALEREPVPRAHSTPRAPPADSRLCVEPAWAACTAGLAQGCSHRRAHVGQARSPRRRPCSLVPPPPVPHPKPHPKPRAPSSSRCPNRAAGKKPPAPLHQREGPRVLGGRVRKPLHSPEPLSRQSPRAPLPDAWATKSRQGVPDCPKDNSAPGCASYSKDTKRASAAPATPGSPAAQRPPAAAQSRQGPSAGCPRTEQARDRGPAGQDSPEVLPPAPLPALAPPPGPGQGLPHTPSQVTTSGTLSPRHLEIQARKGAGPSSGGPSGSPRRLVWEAGRAPRSPCLGREANQGLSR